MFIKQFKLRLKCSEKKGGVKDILMKSDRTKTVESLQKADKMKQMNETLESNIYTPDSPINLTLEV